MHNRRVSTTLGVTSVLLVLITSSMGFVSNGYQKVDAAANIPNSDLAAKITDSINAKIKEPVPPLNVGGFPSAVKLTLTGFPHQTSESVTNIGLTCSGGIDAVGGASCIGFSKIVIPGIGEGDITAHFFVVSVAGTFATISAISSSIERLPGQTWTSSGFFSSNSNFDFKPERIDLPGIGLGLGTVQLLS